MSINHPSVQTAWRGQAFRTLILLATVVASGAVGVSLRAANDADMILHGGKVLTADSAFTVAEAVAIKNGRIVGVGTSRDILARECGPQTRVIDLKGRTVLPGLMDSHTHPMGAAVSELTTHFAVIRSFDDIRNYIRQQAAKTPKGQWIFIPKTFPARLKEMRMPTRDVLDAALDHPVYYDASYANAVNSYALKMSGITRDTPDPPREGARIIKDAKGEPNGILTGQATALLKGLPRRDERLSEQQRLDALEAMLKRYAAAGLTGVTDRGANEESIQAYKQLKAAGRLPIRVVMTYRGNLEQLRKSSYRSGQGDEWLKFGAFKVGLDGGINAGTSFMREPWQPYSAELFGFYDPKMRGDLRIPFDELAVIMRVAWEQGWPMSAHAQGAAAIEGLLDVWEKLDKEKPIAATRSHPIHASFLTPDIIARAKRLGAMFDVQPDWFYFDGLAMSKVVSPQALRYFNPYQSLAKAGVLFAGGSDHMIGWDKNNAINAYNPFLGMYAAITRKTSQGVVLTPEEKLTREQALRMYSNWGALLNHAEKERGSVESGRLADLVVIDRDYLTCPEEQIKDIQAMLTIVEGRIVYDSESPSTASAGRTPERQ
jgi:predicted amidohydrolase YtcJ